jgi:hypothetical protein
MPTTVSSHFENKQVIKHHNFNGSRLHEQLLVLTFHRSVLKVSCPRA